MNKFKVSAVLLLSVLLLAPACKKEEAVDEDQFYHDQIVGHYVATDEIPWLYGEDVDVNGDGFLHSNMSKEFCGLNGFVPAWITADIEEVERSSLSHQKFLINYYIPRLSYYRDRRREIHTYRLYLQNYIASCISW